MSEQEDEEARKLRAFMVEAKPHIERIRRAAERAQSTSDPLRVLRMFATLVTIRTEGRILSALAYKHGIEPGSWVP